MTDPIYRIRFDDGTYFAGGMYAGSSKKGKAFIGLTPLKLCIGHYATHVRWANDYQKNSGKWKVLPKDVRQLQDFKGAKLVNESEGTEVDALEWINDYLIKANANK
jgi:hypothetical protein